MRTPQTGEGLHGERLSPLPNVSKDFPNPTPVDLGAIDPSVAKPSQVESRPTMVIFEPAPESDMFVAQSTPVGDLETTLPQVVTHAESVAQCLDRLQTGHPKR